MSMVKSTLVSRVRRLLNEDPWHDICTEVMDNSETGLDIADTTKWSVGDYVEFQDNGEQCLVTALPSATTLTVVRGVNGTTAATHAINGDIVKTPTFQYIQVTQAITSVVYDLWPHVYKKVAATLTPSTTSGGYYSVAAEMVDLSSVVQMSTSDIEFPQFYGERRSLYPIELVQGLPSGFPGVATTGKAVHIPYLYNGTKTILVNGIGKLTDTETAPGTYDDFSAGVESDTVAYFTVEELVASSDVSRSTGTDTTMNDQSVTPGRRSDIALVVWHKKGLRARGRWEEDLRQTLPRLQSFDRR